MAVVPVGPLPGHSKKGLTMMPLHRIRNRSRLALVAGVALVWLASVAPGRAAEQVVQYPGRRPATARSSADEKQLVLENDVIRCVWSVKDAALRPARELAERDFGVMRVSVITVMMSELTPEGSVYTPIRTLALA